MLQVQVAVSGIDGILATFQGFLADATRELGSALLEAGNSLTAITQNMPPVSASTTGYAALGIPVAPKYGGTLRQSVHADQISALAVEVRPDTDYADFVYFGTVKMEPRPFLQWALQNFGGLQKIDEIMQRTLDRLLAV